MFLVPDENKFERSYIVWIRLNPPTPWKPRTKRVYKCIFLITASAKTIINS